MLYKPNFCCHCGEKIQRVDWNLLTSRRFCEACAVENKRHDHLPKAAVGAGLLAVAFGVGTMLGGASSAVETSAARSEARPAPVAAAPPPSTTKSTEVETAPQPAATTSSAGLPVKQEKGSAVYYCGALTKKGTPCSRKVKTSDTRCYQHEGKPVAEGAN